VDDLEGVWNRGFRELELVKRASLAGTGTCQGSVCLPHVRSWIAARTGEEPPPFTARPASRQITLGEAAADVHLDAFRRTPLHDEHLAAGAQMDRFGGWWRPWHYGDHLTEYRAVREAVSLGDVSTLGKFIVSGPDAVGFLQRLYPTDVSTIRPGRSRYALLLNERGHVIDDGMICRESDDRFVLTFTTGGAGRANASAADPTTRTGRSAAIRDSTSRGLRPRLMTSVSHSARWSPSASRVTTAVTRPFPSMRTSSPASGVHGTPSGAGPTATVRPRPMPAAWSCCAARVVNSPASRLPGPTTWISADPVATTTSRARRWSISPSRRTMTVGPA
ncbi:MAG: hypothetical protein ACREKB_03320, partial [Candidatus Rokuibacteriota bacterium]